MTLILPTYDTSTLPHLHPGLICYSNRNAFPLEDVIVNIGCQLDWIWNQFTSEQFCQSILQKDKPNWEDLHLDWSVLQAVVWIVEVWEKSTVALPACLCPLMMTHLLCCCSHPLQTLKANSLLFQCRLETNDSAEAFLAFSNIFYLLRNQLHESDSCLVFSSPVCLQPFLDYTKGIIWMKVISTLFNICSFYWFYSFTELWQIQMTVTLKCPPASGFQ